MILEIMQRHYLAQTVPDLNRRIHQFLQDAQNDEPEAQEVLRKFKVDPSEIRQALNRLQEAEGALASEEDVNATFFVADPRISQAQSVLQRYFIANNLIQKNVT